MPFVLVGAGGIEPPTSSTSRARGHLETLPATSRRTVSPQLKRGVAQEAVGLREGGRCVRSGKSLAYVPAARYHLI
jgi:hypothetical protein